MARQESQIRGYHYNTDNEDRLAQEPTSTQIDRYSDDKIYGGALNNIFDHKRRVEGYPGDEGDLFHRAYDESGKLSSIRIFAQTHRNILQVKTVTAEDVASAINDHVNHHKPELPEISVDLLDKDVFLAKVQKFNNRYGNIIEVDIDDFGKIKLLFKENIMALIDNFKQLEEATGFTIDKTGGFNRDGQYSGTLEFANPDRDWSTISDFDPDKHQDTNTKLILGVYNIQKFAPLIKLYVEQKLKTA
ncbi:hypothetical protein COT75_00690 [Candidatus Beckwithbacteria bacterium CG10_big_fil_rev_8_21_14_0_10_34_10]|uniref:Uncharacterized protein n=1 Tax=Candidatus Beckwithbacteria bacterium CG10_big_fil_rev_8_21_14_0_10_34_10 TaxID=1974495 RepID=A0A2H0WCR6_9BACT|nr:MAG: hypothetical protein COT75_00690 [Candidatus Beckwithbacteria bacterium CG10_big_fil_rev_8_21_14_0_10_34_10]